MTELQVPIVVSDTSRCRHFPGSLTLVTTDGRQREHGPVCLSLMRRLVPREHDTCQGTAFLNAEGLRALAAVCTNLADEVEEAEDWASLPVGDVPGLDPYA